MPTLLIGELIPNFPIFTLLMFKLSFRSSLMLVYHLAQSKP